MERVSASLRPPDDEERLAINRIVHERAESGALTTELWTHRRLRFDEQRYRRRQYVAEDAHSRQILGYGSIEQTIYLPRYRLFRWALSAAIVMSIRFQRMTSQPS